MGDLTITFLGTGTSHGVPVIGCDCAVCNSADARNKRSRSSIHVATPEMSWVVDTGADFRTQCLREGVQKLDAVLYTHAHTDHIMGFDDLRVFCFGGRHLPIHASGETMGNLERVFQFAFNGENRSPGYVLPEPHRITGPFELGRTGVTPLPVEHGRTEVTGYLFSRSGRKLAAYLSDCNVIPESVMEEMRGVDTLIIDALRHKPHPTHLTVKEAMAVAGNIQPRQTWFTHICHDLDHAATEAELPPGVRMAYDGLKVTL